MRPDSHELYSRRRSRNVGLGLTLGAIVALVFAVTVVKLTEGQMIKGYDHVIDRDLLPRIEDVE